MKARLERGKNLESVMENLICRRHIMALSELVAALQQQAMMQREK